MTTDFALTPNGPMHLRLKALREAVSVTVDDLPRTATDLQLEWAEFSERGRE